jgi:hypothetical protein
MIPGITIVEPSMSPPSVPLVQRWATPVECVLLDVQIDPEQDEGPEQDRQDCRGDRLEPAHVREVVV